MATQKITKRTGVFLSLIALAIFTTVAFAFNTPSKKISTLYFHYIPVTMSEAQYENNQSWELSSPGEAGCDDIGSITCLVPVEESAISGQPGITQEEKFASLLAAQSSAVSYVDANRTNTKSP